MTEPIKFKERIIKGLRVVPETAELLPYKDKHQFWVLEGEDSHDEIDVRFLIYNCSGEGLEFSKEDYEEVIKESDNNFFRPVMIFENLDHELRVRTEIYKQSRTANEKKSINKYFDEKIGIYTDGLDTIEIEVEQEGINYLEYKTSEKDDEKKYLSGYIYNISYSELKKILNVTGKNLFRENVRIGLNNNKTGEKLKKAFKDYIKVGLYLELIKDQNFERQKDKLVEVLELNSDIIKQSRPNQFWFYHNGVTIFSYGKNNLNRSNNRIKLELDNISIINGAQTITNFYTAINEVQSNFFNIVNDLEVNRKYDAKWLEHSLLNICNEIKIKTIIIDGSGEIVNKISIGLNTQIPIEDEDRLAKSEEVKKINTSLKATGISITRDGEVSAESNLSVLEYVKKYLIIKQQPGKSKNFNKKELDLLLKDSMEDIKDKRFINKLKTLLEIDTYWKQIRDNLKDLDENNISNINYYKYGKNYFGSYLTSKDTQSIDEENIYNLFNQFINEFKLIQSQVSLEDFKKDDLYKNYLEKQKTENKSSEENNLDNIDREELINFVNNNKRSKYSMYKVISEYLSQKDVNIPYYRVIARTKDKIKEAYPFPNRTFSELYQNKDETQNVAQIEYEDSELNKEINKEFLVFIIFWEIDEDRIEDIHIIKNFSFKEFQQEAKVVFNRTKDAFEQGDESMFIKSSENMKFHIRPKAINSEDTFEFSNGMQITKRTFWANKETIKDIIDRLMPKEKY